MTPYLLTITALLLPQVSVFAARQLLQLRASKTPTAPTSITQDVSPMPITSYSATGPSFTSTGNYESSNAAMTTTSTAANVVPLNAASQAPTPSPEPSSAQDAPPSVSAYSFGGGLKDWLGRTNDALTSLTGPSPPSVPKYALVPNDNYGNAYVPNGYAPTTYTAYPTNDGTTYVNNPVQQTYVQPLQPVAQAQQPLVVQAAAGPPAGFEVVTSTPVKLSNPINIKTPTTQAEGTVALGVGLGSLIGLGRR